jgi:cbb3-type cytochrome oxidase maturation protein
VHFEGGIDEWFAVSTLHLVLPLALVVAATAVGAFIWAVRSGQMDDVDTPARRILFDDPVRAPTTLANAKLSGEEARRSHAKPACEPSADS